MYKVSDINKMDDKQLIDIICELFFLMPGVSVIDKYLSEDIFKIEFTITNSKSRLLVVYLAEVSNTKLDLWAVFEPYTREAEANLEEAIHYRFSINDEGNAVDLSKWLSAHLVWQMYACHMIEPDQEKYYCQIFGANSRSA